ncbi:hypothetical protein O3P69_010010 [Scylla paramamosain]|uniref:Calcium-activated chloride channel N-terminal domain-containing protein n=1 Tax=Scylla paramamosain TaxID=85552 RepID=A0AAW0SN75_SCYPA
MTELSKAMKRATRERLYLAEVTILLPKTWSGADGYQEATLEKYEDSLIRVLPPNPVYGEQPYTVQPGQCGEPGLYMHLTSRYLINDDVACRWGDRGKALMKEWTRLRWGAFDESGYKDDSIFPLYYPHASGEEEPHLVPNVCSDEPVIGKYKKPSSGAECKLKEDKECRFVPNYLQNASSSLMSNHHLSTVHEFCDADGKTHNSRAPTRHNLLCGGQSVWEVISKHPDLEENSKEIEQGSSVELRFTVVREVPTKYMMALETTSAVKGKEALNDKLKERLTKWLRDGVSDESFVGLVEFGSITVKTPLKLAGSGSTRLDLIDKISDLKSLEGPPCYGCVLSAVLQLLGGKANNSVILLVASGEEPFTESWESIFLNMVKGHNIRVHILLLSEEGKGVAKLKELNEATTGRMFPVKQSEEDEAVREFIEEAQRAESSSFKREKIMIQESTFKGKTKHLNRSFGVDDSVSESISFMLTTDRSQHVTRWPFLVTPAGNKITTETNGKRTQFSVIVTNPEVGLWRWEVVVSGSDLYSINVTVSAPRTTTAAPLAAEAWMNAKSGDTFDASAKQLHLYTRIRRQESPVTGASVRALVSQGRPTAAPREMQLLDVGAGADTLAGDGIYSRSVTFTEEDVYFFKIEVSDNNSSYYKKDSFQHTSLQDIRYPTLASCPDAPSGDPSTLCCGSVVPSDPQQEKQTRLFNRIINLGSLKITGVSSSQPALPPSQIRDLKVKRAWINRLSLSWTAPGGEGDRGNVTSYEFLLATRDEDFPKTREADGNPLILLTHWVDEDLDLEFGQNANLTLNLTGQELQEKRLYFLALRSENEAGEKSVLSNIARLVPEGRMVNEEDEEDVEGEGNSEQGGGPNSRLISLDNLGMSAEEARENGGRCGAFFVDHLRFPG